MVDQTRLEAMYRLRQAGTSLQEIANHFGLSRERVRRLLTQHYGSTRVQRLLTAAEVTKLAGCGYRYIVKLTRQGVIKPAMVVGQRTLWQAEAVDTITAYTDRHRCRVCHRPLPSHRRAYCSPACSAKAPRYESNPEQARRRRKEAVARWRAAHPERARRIQRPAERRYRAKKSAERGHTTEYVIRQRCPVPLGTVVRLVGRSGTKLTVAWGERTVEVPFGCVKRKR